MKKCRDPLKRKRTTDISDELKELMHLARLAELGRLSASVAHEINNPLMVVQGLAENIELLLNREGAIKKEEIRLYALEIIKSCVRMSRIINRMNRMSNNQQVRLHVVDITELVFNAIDFLKIHIEDLGIRLDLKLYETLPAKCDVTQMEQVILNVLNNAIHALEKTKGPREITLSGTTTEEAVVLTISNNGPAIPRATLAKLMKPFTSTKGVGKGNGLGLAISKSIMAAHQGDIKCTQSTKTCTKFEITLPKIDYKPWVNATAGSSGTIVIVDRQKSTRQIFSEKFRCLGFTVNDFVEARSGIIAAEDVTPIAVFLDIVPGQKESSHLVRTFRKLLGPHGLVFAMSGYPSAMEFRSDLIAAGANEVFEKPIHAEIFDHILRQLSSAAATYRLANAG